MNRTKTTTVERMAIAAMAVVVTISAPVLGAAPRVVPGEQRRWALDFRVRLEQPGGDRPIEIDLRGDWVSTVVAARNDEYDVALELAGASIQGGAKGAPAQEWRSRPFWATYRKDGALLAVHFRKEVNPSDRNLLQTIATETQLVFADPDRPVWAALERDGAGEYMAVYNRLGGSKVVKRKLKYVYTDGAAGVPADRVRVDIGRSELQFSLDAEGDIAAVEGANQVTMSVSKGGAGQLTARTAIRLAGPRRTKARELIGSLSRALPDVETSPVITQQPDPERLRARQDARLIEGRTTESLLEAAVSGTDDGLVRDRLAALFRERPEAAQSTLAMLRKAAHKRITDALGAAGSPAAIAVLGAVACDRTLPRPIRIDALTALFKVRNPSPEAMRLPDALLHDDDTRIASAARMASGALARAGRASRPEEADAIDAELVALYRHAHEAEEICELLAALGNSTGDAVVPVIKEALRDHREAVRAAAARALRLANGSGIDDLLAATIAGDRAPIVRAAAIFAAGFRNPIAPVIGDALVGVARADPVEHVRTGAVTLLRQNPNASPHIRETLVWVAEHDPEPGVRRLAAQAITPAAN